MSACQQLKNSLRIMRSAPRKVFPFVTARKTFPHRTTDITNFCLASGIAREECTVQTIKESLDKRAGGPWHVVAGMNFAFDVTHKVTMKMSSLNQPVDSI